MIAKSRNSTGYACTRLLGDHLGRPLVRCRITIAVKNLRRVVAEQRIDLVLAVAPVGIQKVWQVLCEPHYRDALGPALWSEIERLARS